MPSSDTSPGWDVTSGPGLTALGLAASRLVESGRPDRLIDDPLGRVFLDAVDSPVPFPTSWPTAGPASDQEALHLHGSRYIGLRTRIYDDEVVAAGNEGIRQVVLLAAGLDTRALRLTWPPASTVFEVDQPQVLAFKDDVLQRTATAAASRRISVGVDLREDWTEPLLGAGFDPEQPTAWVAEGLLAYLPPGAERTLLQRISDLSASGSRFAADRLLPNTDDDVQRLSERSGLDMTGILDTRSRQGAASVLTELSWQVHEVGVEALATRYGRDLSDPFAQSDAATPPWLATAFVFARLTAEQTG